MFLYILAALMMVIGVAGAILPVLPGLPLTFAGMLLAAWVGDFERVGWVTLTVLGGLTLLSVMVDLLSTALGAQRLGASRKAIIGSIIGTFAGMLFLPIGLLLGPLAGALIGELLHGRGLIQATKVGLATWVGLAIGVALKVGLAFAMLAIFLVVWFYRSPAMASDAGRVLPPGAIWHSRSKTPATLAGAPSARQTVQDIHSSHHIRSQP